MNTYEKIEIVKSYGFLDKLIGFRSTTLDLYGNNHASRPYFRRSDISLEKATDKLYEVMERRLFRECIIIWNEREY